MTFNLDNRNRIPKPFLVVAADIEIYSGPITSKRHCNYRGTRAGKGDWKKGPSKRGKTPARWQVRETWRDGLHGSPNRAWCHCIAKVR